MRFSDRLPPFLARRLAGRPTVQQALENSVWLFADQIVRMAAGLLVGVWMARYLGPEQYGWLSYAAALVGTVGTVTSLGLNAVVVRELVRTPTDAPALLGAAFFLRVAGGAAGFLACLLVVWLQPAATAPTRPLVFIAALGLVFQGLDVYDVYFQSRGESRVSAFVRIFACVAASLLKVVLILRGASLVALALATLAELVVAAAGWLAAGRIRGAPWRSLVVERGRVAALLREGWPLALSGLAVYTQAYADQVIIGLLLGGAELGQYAAALRIVSVFAFVPTVLQTVAAPEITRAHRDDERLYQRRLYDFYRVMFGLFVLTAVPLIVLGPLATRLVFGASYAGAAALLPLLALRLFFANLGVARSAFLTNEGLFRFGLLTALAGAVVNLGLNVFFIPRWGATGAILASFVSFGVTTFALEAFEPRARANLRLMARAVCTPWRPAPA